MSVKKSNAWLIPAVIFIDQITKYFAERHIFFAVRVIENPGLPFGINLSEFFNLLTVVSILLVFTLLYFRYFHQEFLHPGFVVIVGGTMSNLADRIFDGKVTDFINLGVTTANFADLAIIAGAAYLIFNPKEQTSISKLL